MIGCFQALNRGLITDVVYFYDLTEERIAEAKASAKRFGFMPWFCKTLYSGYAEIPEEIHTAIRAEDTILAPTARDTHAQHASVSRTAREYKERRKCSLMFYTVDMESFQKPLPEAERLLKKQALAELFPSQSVLLENEKYHLFEGLVERDHRVMKAYFKLGATVTMKGYFPPEDIIEPEAGEQDETYLNRLIVAYYNRSMVTDITVTMKERTLEFNG